MLKKIVTALALGLIFSLILLYFLAGGLGGHHEGPGTVTDIPIAQQTLTLRQAVQDRATPQGQQSQILFGDFHVHTTLSLDAFGFSLPLLGGEGSHPQADACDFARYCSALDFWSINDHAEGLTQRRWRETVDSIRQCNAVASNQDNPDTVAFLGWEWTQMGESPDNHYGHKNVILAGLKDEQIPTRPIAARATAGLPSSNQAVNRTARAILTLAYPEQRSLDAGLYYQQIADQTLCPSGVPVRDLPLDCREEAGNPQELFAKLDEWAVDAMVIPHGTTWGNYTPPSSSWRKQLPNQKNDSNWESLVEIYSGHGSAEEYRPWRAANRDESGHWSCPPPQANYTPSCWRAGEIIQQRCLQAGFDNSECNKRAEITRQAHVERGIAGHLVVAGAQTEDWLDSGQCNDCFLPAFNHRPLNSAQAMLAMTEEKQDGTQSRARFGFIGSSDNHTARPGTGYKEYDRREMTEATGVPAGTYNPAHLTRKESAPEANLVDISLLNMIQRSEAERITSFFYTGGLVAVQAQGRSRRHIWEAVKQRRVYATSGERMLLWFDLINDDGKAIASMGADVEQSETPAFRVSAVGAFEQLPGCPDNSLQALGEERLYKLCRNECYNPSGKRKKIQRLEVVKITPQVRKEEALAPLIQDPWLVHECDDSLESCSLEFSDPDYSTAGRDAVYYVRALQAASPAVNGANLRCERDATGQCVALKPCYGDANLTPYQDDCLAPIQERAWSSPIFVDWSTSAGR